MKKIILLYLVLQFSHSLVNAQVELGSYISTVGGLGAYPTHIDSLGKGGYMVLPTIAVRDNIPIKRRKQGMLVYVQSVDSLYKLNSASLDNTWISIGLTSSVDVARFVSYAKLSDSLFIRGNSIMDSNLYVKGQGRFDSILTVNDSLRVKGNVLIDSNLTVLGRLNLSTALEFNDSLIVSKGARIDQSILAKSKLYVSDSILAKGNVKIDANLFVKGQGRFDSILTVNDSLRVKGNVLIDSNLTVLGKLSLSTALEFNDSLIVSKGARIDQSILAKSKLYVTDSILAMGNVKIDNNLFVKNHNINDSIMKYSTSKLNVDDTSAMLLDYLTKINNLYTITSLTNSNVALKLNKSDTSTLSNRINLKVNAVDTAYMLNSRFARDTASLSNRISKLVTGAGDLATLKLNIVDTVDLVAKRDTAAMLSARFKRDTTFLSNRIDLLYQSTFVNNNLKLNIVDTSSLLQKRDTISLSNRIDAVVAASNVMQSNIKVNFGGGSFGKYHDGDSIPSKGKTIDAVLKDIVTLKISPYYTPPSASLSMGRSGTVEIGTNLGTLTYAPSFTKNLGGNYSSIAYFKNGSQIASNAGTPSVTDAAGQLLTQITYMVSYTYAAGTTILQNNLGEDDVTNQVTAGSVNSNTITITPASYKYWGMTNKTSTTITDTDIIGMSGGGQDWATSKAKSLFTITNSSGVNYAFYAYPSVLGDLTSITSGGFESLNAFDKIVKNFTNAQGKAVSYNIYVQKNGGTENVSIIIN